MKHVPAVLLFFLAMSMPLFAQTTYNHTYQFTTQAGGGKANMTFITNVVESDGPEIGTQFELEVNTAGYALLDTLPYPGTNVWIEYNNAEHWYTQFPVNPDGSRNPFSGVVALYSNDESVKATFYFNARFVNTCSGRGCGGTLGWHYDLLPSSTIETTF